MITIVLKPSLLAQQAYHGANNMPGFSLAIVNGGISLAFRGCC